MTLGTSFARWRAESLGLDYRVAFARLCDLGFDLVRLSVSWLEVTRDGWLHADWLMAHAAAVRQPVVLTVGMKALGWPEFYLPEGLDPDDRAVQRSALRQVAKTVRRYAGTANLTAWQIENEPFNRSGPSGRCIPRSVVRAEAQIVRRLDPLRPLIVTCFSHFSDGVDRASRRPQARWRQRLGLELPAEREALAVLRRGDVLGIDLYRSIGWLDDTGTDRIARADADQLAHLARWQRVAGEQGKRLWVTEAQAEPWEARRETHANPTTVTPDDVVRLIDDLRTSGIERVLLWGSEYWLWREQHGDSRWIEAALLGRRALA